MFPDGFIVRQVEVMELGAVVIADEARGLLEVTRRHVDEGRRAIAVRLLAPGDEHQFYRSNPGEGWAETYAHLKYPDVQWDFNPLMAPDATAYAAARRDVAGRVHANGERLGAELHALGFFDWLRA